MGGICEGVGAAMGDAVEVWVHLGRSRRWYGSVLSAVDAWKELWKCYVRATAEVWRVLWKCRGCGGCVGVLWMCGKC